LVPGRTETALLVRGGFYPQSWFWEEGLNQCPYSYQWSTITVQFIVEKMLTKDDTEREKIYSTCHMGKKVKKSFYVYCLVTFSKATLCAMRFKKKKRSLAQLLLSSGLRFPSLTF
jgi:hypothetical protein